MSYHHLSMHLHGGHIEYLVEWLANRLHEYRNTIQYCILHLIEDYFHR